MSLKVDQETCFSCSLCADCCTNPWGVLVHPDKRAAIEAQPWPEPPGELFEAPVQGLSALKKHADTNRCVLLDEDNLCRLHKLFGEESKPKMCQRFPYLHTASDEKVWVTASYGCRAVSEGRGVPLEEHREGLERLYHQDLEETSAEADTLYPLRPGVDWRTEELDAALDQVDWGQTVFDTMAALARLAWDVAPNSAEAEGTLRYAMALTLYSDLVGEGFWGRLRGVFTLPQALAFSLRYQSRLLGQEVDLQQVRAHPGVLPDEGHALLQRWLRSRVRSRRVFRNAPHAAAGITRLLIHANLVLLFARAQGPDAITGERVREALRTVERYIANQEVVNTLTRLDPRLKAAWENPQVAWAAVDFFRSASQG